MIRRSKDASRAVQSHIEIPLPEGLSLFPFQRAGVEYMLQRQNTLLSDEMGCGKSCQSVAVSNCLPEVQKILIVCPASLKITWAREWERFDVKKLSVGIAGKTWPTTNVVIINYDILKKYRNQLRQQEYDLMILDECHYLKGKSDRTRETFGGVKRDSNKKIIEKVNPILAKRKLLLSGTPLLNKPKDLWNLISAIDSDGLGADWFTFAKRYCNLFEITRFNPAKGKEERIGWDWSGNSNLPELQEKMRERFLLRRLKSEVLKELPPKTRQVVVLESSKKSLTNLLKSEMMFYEEYVKNHGEVDPPAFTEISKIRKEVALAKIPFVIDYLKGVLENEEKVVCFAHHTETIRSISDAFGVCCVTLTGQTNLEDRQIAIDRFQKETGVRIFVASIQAGGVGITLTAAKVAIFAELSWTAADIDQAESRLHRIGQRDSVLSQFLVLQNSLDERIINAIIAKENISNQVLDKETA